MTANDQCSSSFHGSVLPDCDSVLVAGRSRVATAARSSAPPVGLSDELLPDQVLRFT